MTRYERIMKMTVGELAEYLNDILPEAEGCQLCAYFLDSDDCILVGCKEGRRLWLEEEFDEDGYGDDELPPLRDDEDED